MEIILSFFFFFQIKCNIYFLEYVNVIPNKINIIIINFFFFNNYSNYYFNYYYYYYNYYFFIIILLIFFPRLLMSWFCILVTHKNPFQF